MTNLENYKNTEWFGKPYNYFGDYLRNKYNSRVLKLPIDAGFGCPNRDGKLDTKGCIFCSEEGSASPAIKDAQGIRNQMLQAANSYNRSDSYTKYLAYFQAFTNTYAPVSLLKKVYDEAVNFPGVIGLMIGTRPDCISNSNINLISGYELPETWIEIGMQSIHEKSLIFLNRKHTQKQTETAIEKISKFSVKTCLHVILGIPGESYNDMIATAKFISSVPVSGIKIHHLHVIKNTKLYKLYKINNYKLPDFDEYISLLCDFLENIRQDIIIHRISGDQSEENLIAPKWGLHKGSVQQQLIKEFHRRGTWQGFLTY